jgi:glycosyltransferase involved in cell wall biosynthesis
MRLLVLTQAVDNKDAALGFFHGWLEEFSRHFERITVICLKEGEHALPPQIAVHSLGKERGYGRLRYVARFYALATASRHDYDAVFIHMNEEYAILGALLWRLWGKKVVLWRNHKMGSWRTKLACAFAHVVCYTSPESYVARFSNAVRMPIGIDTDQFAPQARAPEAHSVLFLGRLDAVKNVDMFVEALDQLADQKFRADIYGSPTYADGSYARAVQERAARMVERGAVTFYPAVRHDKAAALYASHAVYVNLTPSGSFDKTIGEALACGCVVVAANAAVKEILGDLLVVPLSADAAAQRIGRALSLSEDERVAWALRGRAYVEQEHSLSLLAERLYGLLISKGTTIQT